MTLKLEICVDSLESAINARDGGADRIELCSSLCLGGLTPSIGLLKVIKKNLPGIPIFCMLRPRPGNFQYDSNELWTIFEDLNELKTAGADGFVFGSLTKDGSVDETNCLRIIELAAPLQVIFHRAFDCSEQWKENLEIIISLGYSRVLTSGQAATAVLGAERIKEIISEAAGRIGIMAGSGVDERTLASLVSATGAHEFHGSASVPRNASSAAGESSSFFETPFPLRVTQTDKVRMMRSILDQFGKIPLEN